ncbi:MAG: hypothetical protein Q7T34_00235 [Candidatus Parcubacteria bacterium]|nr:hypothetical protein [Candidatus Parcubacteria bacterium]
MKKLLLIIALLGGLAVFMFPSGIFAQNMQINECCRIKGVIVGAKNGYCDIDRDGNKDTIQVPTSDWGLDCTLNTIDNITNWAFTFLLAAATICILLAAFSFITAQGDPAKIILAKDFLLYSLVGVLVAVLARGLVQFVQKIIG